MSVVRRTVGTFLATAGSEPDTRMSDAELADFLVVVLAVEDFPLLGAFEDDLALAGDLGTGSGVDAGLFGEQRLKSFAGLLSDGVAILEAYSEEMRKSGAQYAEMFKKVKGELARKYKAVL